MGDSQNDRQKFLSKPCSLSLLFFSKRPYNLCTQFYIVLCSAELYLVL